MSKIRHVDEDNCSQPRWSNAKIVLLGNSGVVSQCCNLERKKQKCYLASDKVRTCRGVGKTSICIRYESEEFRPILEGTVGASFVSAHTDLNGDGNNVMEMQIWDTAGQERFRALVPMYLRNSTAVILVFDLTCRKSFDDLQFWMNEIERADCNPLAAFIVGNKSDEVSRRQVNTVEAHRLAAHYSTQYFELSAHSGDGVRDSIRQMAEIIAGKMGEKSAVPDLTMSWAHEKSFDDENCKRSSPCCTIL